MNIHSADMFTICEQLEICFRWVDTDLEVHEEFIGSHEYNLSTAH